MGSGTDLDWGDGGAEQISDQNDAPLSAEALIAKLAQDNRTLIAALREAKEAASAAGDNATGGAINDWMDQAEQRVWFLTSVIA